MKKEIVKYFEDILNVKVSLQLNDSINNVPVYLKAKYTFYDFKLFERVYALLISNSNDETPGEITKYRDVIKKATENKLIFVFNEMTAYNRQRLIKNKVQFIVPGRQMYLPDLMIDLREFFNGQKKINDYLSPVTQVLIIYHFLYGDIQGINATDLAKKLSYYSKVSISRAFDELERFGLGELNPKGKNKKLSFHKKGLDLWNVLLPLLRNPIIRKETVYVDNDFINKYKSTYFSGITALSNYSSLAEEQILSYAIYQKHYNLLSSNKEYKSKLTNNRGHVEIWRYDPGILTQTKIIDPLSLYLSLMDESDERIKISLDEMLKEIKW